MNQKNRLYGILGAGILTGLVLAVILAFGWGGRSETEAAEAPTATITIPPSSGANSVEALQAENEQLRAAVNALQTREEAYRSQLERANQTVLELQQAPASRNEDAYEHEEHEREHDEAYEHEYEEHEYDD